MDSLTHISGKRVLITGGSGFIGRHLRTLVAERKGILLSTSSKGGDGCQPMDLTAPAEVQRILAEFKPDIIFHLASVGVTGKSSFAQLLAVNTIGTATLLECCNELVTSPTVVLAGSGYEYAPQQRAIVEEDPIVPTSQYGISKAAATQYAMLSPNRSNTIVLRLFNVYGPGEAQTRLLPQLIRAAISGTPVNTTLGEQIRDFVFVQDVAEAFIRCSALSLTKGPIVLNLGSGSPIRLSRFIESTAAALKKSNLDLAVNYGATPYREGEPMHYEASTRKLRELLNWLPETPLDAGLALTITQFLQNPPA